MYEQTTFWEKPEIQFYLWGDSILKNQKDPFKFKETQKSLNSVNRLIRYKILLCHLVLSQLNSGNLLGF